MEIMNKNGTFWVKASDMIDELKAIKRLSDKYDLDLHHAINDLMGLLGAK